MPDAATPLASDSRSVLKAVFGHADFRPGQHEIVEHVAGGGDALVLMPTGGGKSICYQVPALVRPGLAVVVSPLIALMEDQVAQLRQMGVAAAALTSSLSPEDARDLRRAIDAGELDLLYVSPERLTTGSLLDQLARVPLALFAIDEAHCVSQWGHDFRPEYRRLAVLAERTPGEPVLTADGTVLLVFYPMNGGGKSIYIWNEIQAREWHEYATVVGINIASPFDHKQFLRDRGLKHYSLFADPTNTVAEKYGVVHNLDGMAGVTEPRPAMFHIGADRTVMDEWIATEWPQNPPYDEIEAELR
jgi:peroxiredoxin